MNKRMKVTIFATCALLMCLIASSALAYGGTSTASVPLNTSGRVYGSYYTLGPVSVDGEVKSNGALWSTVTGYMFTKGLIFSVNRDQATCTAGGTTTLRLYWANSLQETGTFRAEAVCSSKQATGYCFVSQ